MGAERSRCLAFCQHDRMSFHKLTHSFNSGEFSPHADSRVDIDKYQSGCQVMENFLILLLGAAVRRPGTEFLGKAKFGDKRCMLVGFNFSITTNFILEFGDKYIRFWSNGLQVQKPAGGVLEVVAPYLESELREL